MVAAAQPEQEGDARDQHRGLTRLGDGLLSDYQMIELMSSPDMEKALKQVKEIKKFDDL